MYKGACKLVSPNLDVWPKVLSFVHTEAIVISRDDHINMHTVRTEIATSWKVRRI